MRARKLIVPVAALVLGGYAGSISSQSPPRPESRTPFEPAAVAESRPSRGSAPLGIPIADLPSPGRCRVWIPGRPAQRQARPGHCSALQRRVPAGAWLVHRPSEDPDRVRVTVNDPRPVYVVSVRLYEVDTGQFIGEE